jgi:NAD(P)-dependent dehydrogenase (short-subunit alcohol dehydrogenase family)
MATDLAGKVFLVTGATEGIGKAAALEFAQRGATMTLVGRSKEKSERVLAELIAQSGNPKLDLLLGDLSKLADLRAIAAAFKSKHERLDVLVNNAGALFQTKQLSADGFEMTFALNHLAYFVLTTELLDLLKKTPGSRVVNTSSGAHYTGKIDFDDLARRPSGRVGFPGYGDSKLANILFTRELARKLAGSGGTANCFHPGFVRTGFGQNNGGFIASAISVGGALFARTPQKGAETLVWLATSPEAAAFHGEYFHDKKVAKTTALGKDDALAEKLWKFTENLCTPTA